MGKNSTNPQSHERKHGFYAADFFMKGVYFNNKKRDLATIFRNILNIYVIVY